MNYLYFTLYFIRTSKDNLMRRNLPMIIVWSVTLTTTDKSSGSKKKKKKSQGQEQLCLIKLKTLG